MPVRSSLSTLLLKAYPFKRSGRKKLARFLGHWLKKPMLWTGDYGITYLLHPNNYIDARILREGLYEKDAVEYFCGQTSQLGCETFLDVGANIGVYSLAILRSTDISHILAFEPDPKNRNQLCASVFLNEADNVIKIHPEALSDVSGESILYAQRDDVSLSTVQSSLEPLDSESIEIVVPILAFDDLYDWKDKKIAVKIDIEGHEFAALKGMKNLMQNNGIFLQIEAFDHNLENVRNLLKSFGLRELAQLNTKYHDYYFTNI